MRVLLSALMLFGHANGTASPYGQDNYEDVAIRTPAMFLAHLLPNSTTALFYKGSKSAHLGNREAIVATGGVLGGGSSINMMQYTRGQRSDFDSWQMPGWNAESLIPFMKKVERETLVLPERGHDD